MQLSDGLNTSSLSHKENVCGRNILSVEDKMSR